MKVFWKQNHNLCHLQSFDAMILFGIDTVLELCRQYVRSQLRQMPPDIVIVNGLNPLLHGFHQLWPYISIAKPAVNMWEHGMAHSLDTYQTLAAELLLKGILVHEAGHWHYTLVRPDFERVGTLFDP